MQYLGVMRGSGMLACGEEQMGRVDYDIDGFLVRPGEVMGSVAVIGTTRMHYENAMQTVSYVAKLFDHLLGPSPGPHNPQ